ncbi:MAG TPA: hypothetical protein VHX66_04705 [Solirubrobacteraceae bacterium]|jgi:hypothetical protein|nr:hypothetical protein [Solirubrobacteraceae bacterium]
MADDVTSGLPADLAWVLREQSVVVPRDGIVFDLVAAWAKAPSSTASATLSVDPSMGFVEALYEQTHAARSTTGVGC